MLLRPDGKLRVEGLADKLVGIVKGIEIEPKPPEPPPTPVVALLVDAVVREEVEEVVTELAVEVVVEVVKEVVSEETGRVAEGSPEPND